MFIVAVTIFVKPQFTEQFITATLDNARNTRLEPNNIRFDLSQAEAEPGRFFLYEVYKSKDDFTSHQQTPHYLRWKEAVADWMAQPRQGVKHTSIFSETKRMQAFEFFGVSRIVFGRGKFAAAGEIAATLGRSPLVVHNGDAVIDRLISLLEASKLSPSILRQRGEPTADQIDAAVELARKKNCDCVIGLGGGSAIDAAKAIAGLLTNGGVATDYMEVVGKGKKITKQAAPWMAMPTTAGTGAEVTRNAVIGLPEKQFKASIRSDLLLARVALVDPELGVSVPPAVTASSGMDALCQLIESFTSTGASPITDSLALTGIPLAAANLLPAYANGSDIKAREAMSLAALLSGQTLTSAGLGAVHGFAAALGANFPIPHGTICAALLPPVIMANVIALRGANQAETLRRYAEIGRRLPGQFAGENPMNCFEFTRQLVRDLNIPPLKEFSLTPDRIPEMIALARKTSSMRFNPIVLSDEALSSALLAAIEGKSSE